MSGEHKEGSPLDRPNLIRRMGGYFLGRLLPSQKSPVQVAVDRENAFIDQRQHAHYHVNLFRQTKENADRLPEVKAQFEKELKQRHSMADRFSLFAEEFYAPFVNTLDLGETKRPGSHDEVVALKEEYSKLLAGLVEAGIIPDELSRREAKPSVHFSLRPQNEEFVTADRNRDLFRFTDGDRVISVAKRMTFLMPAEEYKKHTTPANPLQPRSVKKIEALIDAQDPELIIPVRTVYYATSKPVEETK